MNTFHHPAVAAVAAAAVVVAVADIYPSKTLQVWETIEAVWGVGEGQYYPPG